MVSTMAERFVAARAAAFAKGEEAQRPEEMGASGYVPFSNCQILDFKDGSAAYFVEGETFPREMRAAASVEAARAARLRRYRVTATWPKGGVGIFYAEAETPDDAEAVVNFVLNRDYHAAGVTLAVELDPGGRDMPTDAYRLDGTHVCSTVWEPDVSPSAA